MTPASIGFLVEWYKAHCDGDWEHDVAIRISTLDNPGWLLDVRIEDTELEGRIVDWVELEEDEMRWLHWRSTGKFFHARCGSGDLQRALDAFRVFAEQDLRS